MIVGFSNSKSFAASKYPLSYILDTYLFISLLMNPILISSLVKKVIEIEEKNKMWQMQIMLGGKVNTILINKFKNLSIKLVFLQLMEAFVFILAARKGINFSLGKEVLIRFLVFNLSVIVINLFFLCNLYDNRNEGKESLCPIFYFYSRRTYWRNNHAYITGFGLYQSLCMDGKPIKYFLCK